jgi:hypothetical protein
VSFTILFIELSLLRISSKCRLSSFCEILLNSLEVKLETRSSGVLKLGRRPSMSVMRQRFSSGLPMPISTSAALAFNISFVLRFISCIYCNEFVSAVLTISSRALSSSIDMDSSTLGAVGEAVSDGLV